jgi:cation:H+ antiporter
MQLFGTVLLLTFLFYTLAKAADVLVLNVRLLARQLGINVFFLGLILGVLTSTPELSIAINSAINKVPAISYGNLIGGIPVAIGLILGMNAVLQRKISTRQGKVHMLFAMPLLMLPLAFGLDGTVSLIDSALLIISYCLFMYISFRENRKGFGFDLHVMTDRRIAQAIAFILGSLIVILLTSNLIVRFTLELLTVIQVPPFLIGLLVFAIGTNIPEIAVAFRAWRNNAQAVSLSNLLGSALANVLILGVLSFLTPVTVSVGLAFYAMTVLTALMLLMFGLMYRSGNKLTRREGFILLGMYALFVLSQVGGLV